MISWFDVWQIVAACVLCGFLASHSFLVATLVVAMTLFVAWLGNWFTVLDGYGAAMLVLPALCAAMLVLPALCAAAGAWLRGALRRRQRDEDAKPAFVPPPPPGDWVPKRRRRAKAADDESFTL